MTPDEFRLVYDMFKQFSMTNEQRQYDYTTTRMAEENQHWLRFAYWVKTADPDVWVAWEALQDIGRGV